MKPQTYILSYHDDILPRKESKRRALNDLRRIIAESYGRGVAFGVQTRYTEGEEYGKPTQYHRFKVFVIRR